jgi:multidrug efflux pump subunit AcrB
MQPDRDRDPPGHGHPGIPSTRARMSRSMSSSGRERSGEAFNDKVFGVFVLLLVALGSATEAALILATVPVAFVGGILALLLAGETTIASMSRSAVIDRCS